jgi:hypothetical protein
MNKRVSIVYFFVLNAFMISGFSQTLTIRLWPDGIPGSITNPSYVEKITTADGRITRCEKVVLQSYSILPAGLKRFRVLICHGGGPSARI